MRRINLSGLWLIPHFAWVMMLLVSMICLALVSPLQASEARIALVIGNSTYAHTTSLRNPKNDADLIEQSLKASGFTVHKHVDLSFKGMRRAIRAFAEDIDKKGSKNVVALVYYAGHGLQVDGTNYLVPVDAKIDRESDVSIETLSLSDMMGAIEQSRARINIVILDACRDNPYQRGFRSTARGLARVDAPTGSLVGYATSPGDTAADGEGRNSPYAQALAKAIQIKGAPIEQVFKRVRIAVNKQTKGRQVPWESSSLTGDFFFMPKDGGSVVAPDPVKPDLGNKPDQTGGQNQDAAIAYFDALEKADEKAYRAFLRRYPAAPQAPKIRALLGQLIDNKVWRRTQTKHTISAYQAYLTAFPNGIYISEARQAIDVLKRAGKVVIVPPPSEDVAPRPSACGHPHGEYRITGVESWDKLHVRAGASNKSRRLGSIPANGWGIAVSNCRSVGNYNYKWCRVRYRCLSGWAYGRFLKHGRTGKLAGQKSSSGGSSGGSIYHVSGVASWDKLNVRTFPSTRGRVIGVIPPSGRNLRVYECRRVSGYSNKWCRVSYRNVRGWVSGCCIVSARTGRRP